MRARGAPSGGAGARSSQGPPQSTSIAMRPRTKNCGGTNAADAPYRPDTYITDAKRDDSVTKVHNNRPNTRIVHCTLVSLQTCIASSDVPRRAIPGATTGEELNAETKAQGASRLHARYGTISAQRRMTRQKSRAQQPDPRYCHSECTGARTWWVPLSTR